MVDIDTIKALKAEGFSPEQIVEMTKNDSVPVQQEKTEKQFDYTAFGKALKPSGWVTAKGHQVCQHPTADKVWYFRTETGFYKQLNQYRNLSLKDIPKDGLHKA